MIGNMHGGCLAAFCDHCLGVVMYPVMEPGSWAATTEFKINYLNPVKGGDCTATADIISMSKRLAVVRIDVENDGQEPTRQRDDAPQQDIRRYGEAARRAKTLLR